MAVRVVFAAATLAFFAPLTQAHISSAAFAIQLGAGRDTAEVDQFRDIEYQIDAPYGKGRRLVTLRRTCPAGERQLDGVTYPRDFGLEAPAIDGTYSWQILVNGKEVEHGSLTFSRASRH